MVFCYIHGLLLEMFHLPFTRRGKRLPSGPRLIMDAERAVVSFGGTVNVLVITVLSCLQLLNTLSHVI